MYEINGFIIWYNMKTHKWDIKKDNRVVYTARNIKEAQKWCKKGG